MTKATTLLLLAALAAGCAHATGGRTADGPDSAAVSARADATPSANGAANALRGTSADASPRFEGAGSPARADVPSLPITFAAVGDVMLGSTFPDETGGQLPPDDGRALLVEVTPILAGADVAFGNLEGPLLDGGTSEKCKGSRSGRCYAFRVPARYGELLQAAGFDVVSLANNHVGDFGDDGRRSTREVLERLGIRYSGAPGEVARLEVRGTRIALVAFSVSAGTNDLRDVPGAVRIVEDLVKEGALVVVSFHGGAEGADYQHVPPGPEAFYGEDRGDLRAFAHAVIDAGAALVLGHGPHVVRGLEVYKRRLVAYSLGNFATYGGMNLSGPNGLTAILEARLAPDGTFLGGWLHAGKQERPGGPRLDPARTVIPLVRQLSRDDFGAAAPEIADDGALAPPVAEQQAAGRS